MEDVRSLLQVAKPHKSKPVKMLDEMIAKDEESEKPVELDMSVSSHMSHCGFFCAQLSDVCHLHQTVKINSPLLLFRCPDLAQLPHFQLPK